MILRSMPYRYLVYTGSISALDEATLRDEAHALQCTTTGPYNAIPTNLLRVGSVCGLGIDILGIHTLSLAAGKRSASNPAHSPTAWRKFKQLVNMIVPPFMFSAPNGRRQEAKGRHSLAPRRNPKAGLCQTSCFTCLQNFWTSQSLSHCTDSASNVSCVTGFSPLADCWFPTQSLQWSVYGTKISR